MQKCQRTPWPFMASSPIRLYSTKGRWWCLAFRCALHLLATLLLYNLAYPHPYPVTCVCHVGVHTCTRGLHVKCACDSADQVSRSANRLHTIQQLPNRTMQYTLTGWLLRVVVFWMSQILDCDQLRKDRNVLGPLCKVSAYIINLTTLWLSCKKLISAQFHYCTSVFPKAVEK